MSSPADRRRSTRVEVLGKIHGQVVSLDVALVVREISLGGMSIETPKAFTVGAVESFLLTLGDGAGVEVHGRVVYSKPAEAPGHEVFVTGIQFVDDDPNTGTPVGGLITKIQ